MKLKGARLAMGVAPAGILSIVIVVVVAVGVITYSSISARGPSSTSYSTANNTSLKAGWVRLGGTTLPFLANASTVSPVEASKQIVVTFYLKDPSNQSAESALVDWERGEGLSPGVTECIVSTSTTSSGGSAGTQQCQVNMLKLNTTVGIVQSLFAIDISYYTYHGKSFYANSVDPALPSAIAALLADIEGLNNYPLQQTV